MAHRFTHSEPKSARPQPAAGVVALTIAYFPLVGPYLTCSSQPTLLLTTTATTFVTTVDEPPPLPHYLTLPPPLHTLHPLSKPRILFHPASTTSPFHNITTYPTIDTIPSLDSSSCRVSSRLSPAAQPRTYAHTHTHTLTLHCPWRPLSRYRLLLCLPPTLQRLTLHQHLTQLPITDSSSQPTLPLDTLLCFGPPYSR